jgi:hypothetical protein
MDFLGHVLLQLRVSLDPRKQEDIIGWQTPAMTKGVKSFLSVVNFYKKFIKGFLQVVKCPINLFKKELSFDWGEAQ